MPGGDKGGVLVRQGWDLVGSVFEVRRAGHVQRQFSGSALKT